MLTVHRLLDTLHGVGNDRLSSDREDPLGVKAILKAELPTAEKFDFGRLPLEESERTNEWTVPRMTRDEFEMWRHGLIPLPAPRCWFEFDLGGTRTGFFVREVNGRWVLTRVDRLAMQPEPPGTPCTKPLPHPLWVVDCMLFTFDPAGGYDESADAISVIVDTPPGMQAVEKENPEEFRAAVKTAYLVLYLALMINSKSSARERVPAPPRRYTAERKGLSRGYSHTVVDIIPRAYKGGAGHGGGSGPKRLHWVRSHLRRYDHQTTGSKWCPMLDAPDGTKDCWAVVVPRHIKGRADLGEVDHEYRVQKEVAP